jgi:hypothetical protein
LASLRICTAPPPLIGVGQGRLVLQPQPATSGSAGAHVWYGWHEDVCQGSNLVLHNSVVTPDPDFSVKPTLTGDTVVLRPFTADDVPGMLQVLRDPEVLKLTGSVHDEAAELVPQNPAEEKKWRD